MKRRVAVYPGSFDPITYGHIDILLRGLELFDKVIVAVANNIEKKSLFTVQERKDLIRKSVNGNEKVIIDSFDGLLVDYVKQVNSRFVIRGLRAMSDFEYEFQMIYDDKQGLFLCQLTDHQRGCSIRRSCGEFCSRSC